jgi:outer membrane protein assembly factor BamD (BamD/ComL family)
VKTAPSAQPSLRAELALLDGAKSALAANDPSEALAKLNQHDREYAKGGQLGDEATMLRIEALRAKGDQTAARAVAKRFLATHPGTTYEDRVTTLLGP